MISHRPVITCPVQFLERPLESDIVCTSDYVIHAGLGVRVERAVEARCIFVREVADADVELNVVPRVRADQVHVEHRFGLAVVRQVAWAATVCCLTDVTTAQVDSPVITEKPGAVIGPYKLLQQIGEGGMGVVYMAEQTEPVERRVALKIIKLGMNSREVMARFESERQALVLMSHPNIARAFEAGATDEGRPFFAMEYVRGLPITAYCDAQRLDTRRRLELFRQVCDGGLRWRTMYFATVAWEISMPSICSSP